MQWLYWFFPSTQLYSVHILFLIDYACIGLTSTNNILYLHVDVLLVLHAKYILSRDCFKVYWTLLVRWTLVVPFSLWFQRVYTVISITVVLVGVPAVGNLSAGRQVL